jgi:hypothetical protein
MCINIIMIIRADNSIKFVISVAVVATVTKKG